MTIEVTLDDQELSHCRQLMIESVQEASKLPSHMAPQMVDACLKVFFQLFASTRLYVPTKGGLGAGSRLTDEKTIEVIADIKAGKSAYEIVRTRKVSKSTVFKIKRLLRSSEPVPTA